MHLWGLRCPLEHPVHLDVPCSSCPRGSLPGLATPLPSFVSQCFLRTLPGSWRLNATSSCWSLCSSAFHTSQETLWWLPCLPVLGGASHGLGSGSDEAGTEAPEWGFLLATQEVPLHHTRGRAFQGGPQAGATLTTLGISNYPPVPGNPEAGQPLE